MEAERADDRPPAERMCAGMDKTFFDLIVLKKEHHRYRHAVDWDLASEYAEKKLPLGKGFDFGKFARGNQICGSLRVI